MRSLDLIVWGYTLAVLGFVAYAVMHGEHIADFWPPLLMVGIVQHNYWKD
jgi:hypothetical protein